MMYSVLHITVRNNYLPCCRVRKYTVGYATSSSSREFKEVSQNYLNFHVAVEVFEHFTTLWRFWGLFTDPNNNSVLPSSMLSLNEPEWLMARGLSSRDVALPHSWESSYRSKEVSCAGMLFERIILGPGRLNWDRLVGLTGIQGFINEVHFH